MTCGYPLTETEAVSVSDQSDLLRACATLVPALDPEVQLAFAGRSVPSGEYLNGLVTLNSMVDKCLRRNRDSINERREPRERLCEWLPTAVDLASSNNEVELQEKLRAMASKTYYSRRIYFPSTETSHDFLNKAAMVVENSMPYIVRRYEKNQTALSAVGDLDCRISPHHIPRMFWESSYAQLKSELDFGSIVDDWGARRVLSRTIQRISQREEEENPFWITSSDERRHQRDDRTIGRWILETIRHLNGDQKFLSSLIAATNEAVLTLGFVNYRRTEFFFRSDSSLYRPEPAKILESKWPGIDDDSWEIIKLYAQEKQLNLAQTKRARDYLSTIARCRAGGTSEKSEAQKAFPNEVEDFFTFRNQHRRVLDPILDQYVAALLSNFPPSHKEVRTEFRRRMIQTTSSAAVPHSSNFKMAA